MTRLTWGLAFLTVLANGAGQVQAGTLWYNGDADGHTSFVNQNNAVFHQIIYNDFTVPTGNIWLVDSAWSNNIFTKGPPASTNATWEIRSDMPTGTLVAQGDAPATLTKTGAIITLPGLSPLDEYQVLVSVPNVSLVAGTYWLAVFPDNTNGGFGSNDTTSGANAVGTPPGNNGNTFQSADGDASFQGPLPVHFDTSAGVSGSASVVGTVVPEPSTFVMSSTLLGLSAVVGLRKRIKKTKAAA